MTNRLSALDGLRGMALLMALLYHGFLVQGFDNLPYARLVHWMWVALDIFFVLSGYLITGILLRSLGKEGYLRNFYLRRALRIFPAYYATLLLTLLMVPLLSPAFRDSTTRGAMWAYWVYFQNWVVGVQGWPDWDGVAHLWSMGVEEQFYLAWPLLVMLCGRQWIIPLCVAIIAVAVIGKVVLIVMGYPALAYASTVTRMDCIAAGALLAALGSGVFRKHRRVAVALCAYGFAAMLAMITVTQLFGSAEFMLGSTGTLALTVVIIGMVCDGTTPDWLRKTLESSFFVWFGTRSYSIYLLHGMIYRIIWEHFGRSVQEWTAPNPVIGPMVVALAFVAIFTAAGVVLFRLVELPAMQLRRHLPETGKVWQTADE